MLSVFRNVRKRESQGEPGAQTLGKGDVIPPLSLSEADRSICYCVRKDAGKRAYKGIFKSDGTHWGLHAFR